MEEKKEKQRDSRERPLTLGQIIKIRGAKEVMICFFCYCALEQTAASYASLFYLGITIGILVLFLPLGIQVLSLVGLVLIGLGCAPVYPCIIHSTPAHFGADKSQAVIGVQMASAYVGTCLMPPLFGLLAKGISITLFPVFLLVLLLLMFIMHERLCRA